jgi:Flp pilus assembly protein TadG
MSGNLERGAVSTELAVITPILIGFMLLVVFAGRVAQAEGDVAHAAHEAARAASLVATPAAAEEAATDTVSTNLNEGAVECRDVEVSVDTSSFAPGGQVAVTVTCEASFADVAMLAVPGTRTFQATAIEVIDTHRADAGGLP